MRPTPGLLAHSRPTAPLLRHVVQAPGLHMKQERGRIVAGEDFGGGPAPDDVEAEGRRLLALVKAASARRRRAGARRGDGRHCGRCRRTACRCWASRRSLPGLYLATMHSGITLAPAVGRFAAMEILDGARVEMLEPYRPERFVRDGGAG